MQNGRRGVKRCCPRARRQSAAGHRWCRQTARSDRRSDCVSESLSRVATLPGECRLPLQSNRPNGGGLTDLDGRKKNPAYWPASGFVDTEKRCLLKLEVVHGKAGICAGVQG